MHVGTVLLAAPALALLAQKAPEPAAGQDPRADRSSEAQGWLMTHYANVLEELSAQDTSELAPDVAARRADLLAELARYRAAGDFTRWSEPGARVPVFVDDGGRHCAVAHLLRFSGEASLVSKVAAADNHAWVFDLRDDAELVAWLAESGLSLEDAARIQGPAVPVPQPFDYAGPGDTVPTPDSPASGGPTSPGPSGPGSPGPAGPMSPGSQPTIAPSGPSTPLGGDAFTDWGLWWEYNKLGWLRPNALGAGGPATGDGSRSENALDVLRRESRAAIAAELNAPEASVRAAAAVAYARAAGAEAVDALKALLDDPTREVRVAALAGLAATHSEQGVHALLAVVHAEEEPGADLRASAIAALAAAAFEGSGRGIGAMLPTLIDGDVDADEAYALSLYADVADDAGLAAFVREQSGAAGKRAKDRDAAAESRALEALADAGADAALSRLLDAAGGRRLEARRGALVALGEVDGALEPLMTAYEGEHDGVARGLALLSIGRQGGFTAREFLVRELERGKQATRPWTALALGVLADADGDSEAADALLAAYADEDSRFTKGAMLLALGIAGDAKAEAPIVSALAAKDATTRYYAAQALGILAGSGARPALRAALVAETTPLVRTAIAQALALSGDARDTETLLAELDRAKDPVLQSQMAAAVGFLGQEEAVAGLLSRLENEDLRANARAATLGALAIGLSGNDRLTLSRASAWSNHEVFPVWLQELLQQPF